MNALEEEFTKKVGSFDSKQRLEFNSKQSLCEEEVKKRLKETQETLRTIARVMVMKLPNTNSYSKRIRVNREVPCLRHAACTSSVMTCILSESNFFRVMENPIPGHVIELRRVKVLFLGLLRIMAYRIPDTLDQMKQFFWSFEKVRYETRHSGFQVSFETKWSRMTQLAQMGQLVQMTQLTRIASWSEITQLAQMWQLV